MAFLYNETQERERKAILIATTRSRFFLDRLWVMLALGDPHWIGINIEFRHLLGARCRAIGLDGDVDVLAVPALGATPDFTRMAAIEIKTIPFSLAGDLKVWDKLDEAEAQAGKLLQIGFRNVAVLHILNTENDPSRDRGGSSEIWDASDRGLAAYDAIRKVVKGRVFRTPTFVWPWGAAPTRGEDEMGAGAIQFLGGPESPSPVPTAPEITQIMVKRFEKMIKALPRPQPVHPHLPANVFSRCRVCSKIVQHFWDWSFCRCGTSATLTKSS